METDIISSELDLKLEAVAEKLRFPKAFLIQQCLQSLCEHFEQRGKLSFPLKFAEEEEFNPRSLLTTKPVIPSSPNGKCQPEWIRLPKGKMQCPWTGLSRSKMNALVLHCDENGHKPPVKSVVLRNKGTIRGVRLVHLASLLDYIDRPMESS